MTETATHPAAAAVPHQPTQAPAATTAPAKLHQPTQATAPLVEATPKKTRAKRTVKAPPKVKKSPAKKGASSTKAPAKLDRAKLEKTPTVALRAMVRARNLDSGTKIVTLTKEQAIALLMSGPIQERPAQDMCSPTPSSEVVFRGSQAGVDAVVAAIRYSGVKGVSFTYYGNI